MSRSGPYGIHRTNQGGGISAAQTAIKSVPRAFSRKMSSILNKKTPCKSGIARDCRKMTKSAGGFCRPCLKAYRIMHPKKPTESKLKHREYLKTKVPGSTDDVISFYRNHDKRNGN